MPGFSAFPFLEALFAADREVMPTDMSSEELRQLDKSVRDQSFFSARNPLRSVLERMKADILSIINPRTEARPDGTLRTVGVDRATARLNAMKELQRSGYQPAPEDRGTIRDLLDERRINLVIDTNTTMARAWGRHRRGQSEGVLWAWPAAELIRIEERDVPRGFERGPGGALVTNYEQSWERRWIAAGGTLFNGRLIAPKNSVIWENLGKGAGGYTDTLGHPFEPFAFNSGKGTRDITRAEAEQLGVIQPGEIIAPKIYPFPVMPDEPAAS